MSILLIHSDHNDHNGFLKNLYSTDITVITSCSLREAARQLSLSNDLDTVLIPSILIDGSCGLQAAERLYGSVQTAQILLLNQPTPPHDGILPDYLHGYLHYSVDLLHLQLIIAQARERFTLQQKLQNQTRNLLLEESRSRFLTTVLDTLHSPVITLSPKLRIISMNSPGYKLLGSPQHCHGNTLSSLLNSNIHHCAHPTVQALQSQTPHSACQQLPGIDHDLLITSVPVAPPGRNGLDFIVEIWEPANPRPSQRQTTQPLLHTHQHTDAASLRSAVIAQITPREWEIIPLLQRGNSYRRIAEQLGISENTVKSHISTIYKKTDCRGRTELIRLLQNHCP